MRNTILLLVLAGLAACSDQFERPAAFYYAEDAVPAYSPEERL